MTKWKEYFTWKNIWATTFAIVVTAVIAVLLFSLIGVAVFFLPLLAGAFVKK